MSDAATIALLMQIRDRLRRELGETERAVGQALLGDRAGTVIPDLQQVRHLIWPVRRVLEDIEQHIEVLTRVTPDAP